MAQKPKGFFETFFGGDSGRKNAHKQHAQSNGSSKGTKDRHQTTVSKGPGHSPGPTKENFKKQKFKK